jgi:hypothetical protein
MSVRARLGVVAAAVAAGVMPFPEGLVERWYSNGIYPRLQHVLTTFSNAVPFAIFDVLCAAGMVATALLIVRRLQALGWRRGSMAAGLSLLAAGAAVYLVFLATWGLNYRRVSLEDKLQFDGSRLTSAATGVLAMRTASELNRLYMKAHGDEASLESLAWAFHDAEAALRLPRPIVPGRPKSTLLGGYFHDAAIAGMTDPFGLETLLAPDLLDVERTFVIAHEWGLLAGFGVESEANFIAWLACLRGSPRMQYSAWLTLFGHVYAATPNKREVIDVLRAGPRIDLRAISDRYARTPRFVRFAARETYDRYLRANRVERGVESYDEVVQLILGATYDRDGNPQMREGPARALQ